MNKCSFLNLFFNINKEDKKSKDNAYYHFKGIKKEIKVIELFM